MNFQQFFSFFFLRKILEKLGKIAPSMENFQIQLEKIFIFSGKISDFGIPAYNASQQ